MLETFKARLKAKSTAAGAQNLTNARLDAMSARLNAKFPDLKEEKDHDEKIDELYDAETFKEFAALDDHQKARDKRAADKKAKDEADRKAKEGQSDDHDDLPADTPPWAKSIIESNKKLSADLAILQSEKAQGTIKSKATELLKEVPVSYWGKRALPDKVEDLEAFVTDVTKDYTDFKQDMVNQGLAIQTPPPAAGGGSAAANGKVSPEVKAFVEKHKPAEQVKTT